ncbi:MAG TPA: RNA polymerase sigma factor [Solirubrobacteraceae bacterium]|nr:RNA polymerase sigma factor [Solirubrobacteraceae bacterium]
MRVLDPNALAQHLDRLYRAAWALCGSREDAEDLVQETFARVLSRPRVLRGENDLYYLLRVLRNTYLSSRRTAGRRPHAVAALDEVTAADPRPMGRPQEALEVQEIYETIAELPEEFRLALIAIDVVGLSYREASRALGVREATVTTRLHRARKRVADSVVQPSGTPGAGAVATHGARADDRPALSERADERSRAQDSERERFGPAGVLESRQPE